jgi:dTMP kinase
LAQASSHPAFFVTFEGIEGAGKSTQIKRLTARLREAGLRVLTTREPGGTPLAETIRNVLLTPNIEPIDARTELLLMLAARSQHVRQVIQPAMHTHDVIVCDRFIDSSTAYQGFGRNVGMETVETLNQFASHDCTPDITFILDIPVELSLSRMKARTINKTEADRFEQESKPFFETLRKAFLTIAQKHDQRCVVLDGTLALDELETIEFDMIQQRRAAAHE